MRIFTNGLVRTMGEGSALAEAMAVDGDRVVEVGGSAEIQALAAPGAEVIDLQGKTIVPGFIDAHHHVSIAVLYEGTVDCHADKVTSLEEICQRLRTASERIPKGEWVVGYGYDDWKLRERRHPTRFDLDRACPDHPVMLLHFSFHALVANSRALELARIGRETPDPPSGRIVRGSRGEPTGVLTETAISRVEEIARNSVVARDGAGFIERLERYESRLFAVGITRVADPMVPPVIERLFRDARAGGRTRLPLVLMPIDGGGYLVPPRARLDGPATGEGTDDLRMGPLKLVFDGGDACAVCISVGQALRAGLATIGQMVSKRSLAPWRAATRGGLRMSADLRMRSGIKYYSENGQALAVATQAVERGFSLAIHAMGNDAIEQAIFVLTALRKQHRDSPPPRIEHAMLVNDALLSRAADAGIMLVVQPAFTSIVEAGGLPPLPGLKFLAHASMLSRGLSVAASSDAPVLGFDPLEGIRRAVHRGTVSPEEAVPVEAALAMYTREAARACGVGDAGVLAVGKRADFVILSGDPYAGLEGVRVLETVLGGDTVYRAPSQLDANRVDW